MDGYGLSETDAEAESGKRWVPAARGWKGEVNLRSVLGSWFLPPLPSPQRSRRDWWVERHTHTLTKEGPVPPCNDVTAASQPTACLTAYIKSTGTGKSRPPNLAETRDRLAALTNLAWLSASSLMWLG